MEPNQTNPTEKPLHHDAGEGSFKADSIEQSLRGLTWWSGPTPELWRRALQVADRNTRTGGPSRSLLATWLLVGVPVVAALVIAVVTVTTDQNRQASRAALPVMSVTEAFPAGAEWRKSPSDRELTAYAPASLNRAGGENSPRPGASPGSFIAPSSTDPRELETGSGVRHVIHKAAVDLQADDVRGVYLKIRTLLPNEANGEYIEQSQIHDQPGQLSAYITLRVRGQRLNEVLNLLRELATVVKEQSDATDVTTQVVDIESRLRNERRVEQELLVLLERRKDSPLEDILKVSQSLAEVRGRIEGLVGQQQQLGRQVALASVVVTIRTKPAKPTEEPQPASETFGRKLRTQFGSAWHDGVSFLIDTLAAFVRVIVGGLVWWVGLMVALWLVRRWYARRAAGPIHASPRRA